MSDNHTHTETPENCTHDCSTCGEACAQHEPESLQQPLRPGSRVDKVIAVVSGKGGVGKSLVTSLLACEMQHRGHQAAVLDADITGPSIPQAFGVHGGAMGGEDFLYANRTRTGIEIMSINLLLPNETDPVVWRGPVIAGAVTQFWTDVQWDNVNYMFVDMPPGTGDVPLTTPMTFLMWLCLLAGSRKLSGLAPLLGQLAPQVSQLCVHSSDMAISSIGFSSVIIYHFSRSVNRMK